ncbi:MAG: hypothetical protein ABI175_01010, partial [Polyangiales bacterium]
MRRGPWYVALVLLSACSSGSDAEVPSEDAGDDTALDDASGGDAARPDVGVDAPRDSATTTDASGGDGPVDAPVASDTAVDSKPATDTAVDAPVDALGDTGTVGSPGCGKTATSGVTNPTLTVAGTARTYVLSIPAGYDSKKAYPLVFGWHGRTDNGTNMRSFSGVETAAAGKAIFVYPNG